MLSGGSEVAAKGAGIALRQPVQCHRPVLITNLDVRYSIADFSAEDVRGRYSHLTCHDANTTSLCSQGLRERHSSCKKMRLDAAATSRSIGIAKSVDLPVMPETCVPSLKQAPNLYLPPHGMVDQCL